MGISLYNSYLHIFSILINILEIPHMGLKKKKKKNSYRVPLLEKQNIAKTTWGKFQQVET